MQFSVLVAAALGLVANVNAVQFEVSPTAAVANTVDKRQNNLLSNVDLFRSSGCNNYQTTVSTFGGGSNNGGCFAFSGTIPSIRPTFLRGGCTMTVYTDSSCSNGATAARLNSCVSGSWRSFSTDNCS